MGKDKGAQLMREEGLSAKKKKAFRPKTTMKNELEYNYFETLDEAKRKIFRYINWYNRERIHSSLGYVNK